MTAYKIKYDFENYYSLIIKNAELGLKMPHYSPRFQATSRREEWVAPNASFYASSGYSSNSVSLPDITTWMTGLLVLNQKSYDCLNTILARSGEFLPIQADGVDYYLFNTLSVIDDCHIYKTKAVSDPDVYDGLTNILFDDVATEKLAVFKSTIDHCLFAFCSDQLKALVEENDLQGLIFEEVKAV